MSFLKYKGDVDKINDRCYVFKMNDNINVTKEKYNEVANPILDNSFQKIFGYNNKITKSLLNSLIFPISKKIRCVQFLPTNIPGKIGARHSSRSIRCDVLCRCILSQDSNEREEEIIINIEMQIGFSKENIQRFIKYLKKLYSVYVETEIIVLVLVFRDIPNPRENKGSKTQIEEIKINSGENVNIFNEFPIFQIDISYSYKSIFQRNENVWLIDKNSIIQNEGKEWIKFLNIANWCTYYSKDYFVFPPLERDFFINEEVFLALNILKREPIINDFSDHESEESENVNEIEECNGQLKQKCNSLKN